MSKRLAETGADVAIIDIDGKRAEEVARDIRQFAGSSVINIQCDVSSSDSVDKMIKEVKDNFGSIDILINMLVK